MQIEARLSSGRAPAGTEMLGCLCARYCQDESPFGIAGSKRRVPDVIFMGFRPPKALKARLPTPGVGASPRGTILCHTKKYDTHLRHAEPLPIRT